jgi:hypothetical protein
VAPCISNHIDTQTKPVKRQTETNGTHDTTPSNSTAPKGHAASMRRNYRHSILQRRSTPPFTMSAAYTQINTAATIYFGHLFTRACLASLSASAASALALGLYASATPKCAYRAPCCVACIEFRRGIGPRHDPNARCIWFPREPCQRALRPGHKQPIRADFVRVDGLTAGDARDLRRLIHDFAHACNFERS